MNIKKEKKEIEERFNQLTKVAEQLQKQLKENELERIELQGQFKLIEKLQKENK